MRRVHRLLVFLDPLALVALCDVTVISSKLVTTPRVSSLFCPLRSAHELPCFCSPSKYLEASTKRQLQREAEMEHFCQGL